jgi:hypothetical protein
MHHPLPPICPTGLPTRPTRSGPTSGPGHPKASGADDLPTGSTSTTITGTTPLSAGHRRAVSANCQGTTASEQPWPDANEIDNAGQYASGSLPPEVDQLPSNSLFASHGLAIGHGWVARRPAVSWHLLQLDQLQSVAIVPPTAFTKVAYSRSVVAPDPDVALQDRSGNSIRIPVGKLDEAGRQELGSQIPTTVEVTTAAAAFLRNGSLPDKWAKRFQFAFMRFG